MNVDLGIWSKLTRVVIFLLLLAAILAVAVWYLPLIKQNERMRKEIVRDVTLHDRDISIVAVSKEIFRSDRRRNECHRVTVRLQDFLHLQKTNADACRLTVSERLGTDEENATHARPFIRSTISCSFQVRDL